MLERLIVLESVMADRWITMVQVLDVVLHNLLVLILMEERMLE
jgi:hypothetical protein